MEKTILVFDMDGVTVDLYGVPDWLQFLRAESVYPYEVAKPLVDMTELRNELIRLKSKGYIVVVTSWLSMGASKHYKSKIKKAKKEGRTAESFPQRGPRTSNNL